MDDKWLNRLKILIDLIESLEQGKAQITWQDKNIIKIEKIETESVIKK